MCRFGKLNFSHVGSELCDESLDVNRVINYLFKNKGYERFFNIKYMVFV